MEDVPGPARSGSTLILDMLAHGIPLTLLPDLAWPDEIAEDDGPAERPACTGIERRPARATGGRESLRQALAHAAGLTARHRRAARRHG